MLFSNTFFSIFALIFIIGLMMYVGFYMFFSKAVKKEQQAILDIFLHKISKVPALIEVMRPYIVKSEAFDAITRVHTETIIESADTLYDILSNNARLENEFHFLMKLSHHAPLLQKHEYFLYIRDFIISYERDMRARFEYMNHAIRLWNRFVLIKNLTLIGYILPGREISEIS